MVIMSLPCNGALQRTGGIIGGSMKLRNVLIGTIVASGAVLINAGYGLLPI